MKKKNTAVFSGTFDPVTVGHIDIIERASALFDEVHVVVAQNPEKKTMFTEDERLELLKASVADTDFSEKVVCAVWDRPVFEYCKKVGSNIIVKGIRNASDFDYEKTLAKQTGSLCPEIETLSFFADEKYDHISSTYVRGCIDYGFPLDRAVPKAAIKIIKKLKK